MYSIRDSAMTIKVIVRLYYKEARANVLLDSGATDNLIDRNLIKKLGLGTKPVKPPRLVRNVDGSLNKDGTITEVCQLWIKRGNKETAFPFFITNLGEDRMIFGYPWFEHENPEIDWKTQELKGEPVTILTSGHRFRLKRHQKVFSDEEAQRFPPEREEDFPIKLRPDAPQKINCKIYPLTPKEDKSLKAYIEENLAKGYIYEGSSPYASSFFFRKKTDGGLRPIIDYRPLNAWTVKDTYPLPLISDILTNLSGKKVFSKFNIRWGYHNIRIKEEDQLKAAFKMPRGLFIPRVMTFGLTNALATFARTMSCILRPLMDTHPKELFVYMDDVLIAMEEDLPRHRKIVHTFLEICEEESY